MIIKGFIGTLLLIAITACTPQAILKEYAGEDRGYVLLSQSATANTKYGSYSINIRPVGNKDQTNRFIYFQNNMFYGDKRDFDNEKSNGIVRIYALAPGKYEIYSYTVSAPGATRQWSPKNELSVIFEVKEGITIYLGEFLAVKQKTKNMLGMNMSWGARLFIKDSLERDLNIAKTKYSYDLSNVSIQIPDIPYL